MRGITRGDILQCGGAGCRGNLAGHGGAGDMSAGGGGGAGREGSAAAASDNLILMTWYLLATYSCHMS